MISPLPSPPPISPSERALIVQLYALLESWQTVRDLMAAEAAQDRSEGLTITANTGECAVLAMDGCIKSVIGVLAAHDARAKEGAPL